MNNEPKKVLIITYYWPPAGGPGVQRWLKFVKYLPEFGVQPIVYVPENPTYPIIDNGLLNEVPKDAIVLKNKIFEPYQLAGLFSKNKTKKISSGIIPNQRKQSLLDKILLWTRGNIFIPDARFMWVKPSVKYLEKYILEHKIDTIITSGPPHSLHLVGLALQSKLNLTWFADFRDPWTTIGYHKNLKLSSYAARKHKVLEKKVLSAADLIIVTSPSTKKEFKALTTKPIEVITNGFDIDTFEKKPLDVKFSLAHIGSFLSKRNPTILWESLAELCDEIIEFKNNLELKLIGTVSQEVLESIEKHNLKQNANCMGYLSHQKAIEHQRSSQVLLLIEIDSEDTKSIIPGKLFEYIASERPIIGIGPKDSDFSTILLNTKTGIFVDYSEKQKLKIKIIEHYNSFLVGTLKTYSLHMEEYSRRNLTKKLAALLQKKILN